ncbi:hypothetical protein IWQ57_003039 [Coemansia nantahalensis]|uniref:Uncharacterized protein n=1 Tax=Coemansia nantahalensis TaxID=2789366 RepID=A0ACC1JYD8_9FUNG|nr:hypothetical protein IWQ57_003039 [Coemansia nantahalensis]
MSEEITLGVTIERVVPIQDMEISTVDAKLSDTRADLVPKLERNLRLENRRVGPYRIYIRNHEGYSHWLSGAKTVGQCIETSTGAKPTDYVVVIHEIDPTMLSASACCTIL